jgi:glucan-binding YG repeat protein
MYVYYINIVYIMQAGWQFDEGHWWLEEHGLIMEVGVGVGE